MGSSLASGPQDGLGQGGTGGTKAEVGQGSIWAKNDEQIKVLRMGLPIVESLSGFQERIFRLFRGPNSILIKNKQIV